MRRQLIKFGYLTHVRVRAGGRFVGSQIEFQIPEEATQKERGKSASNPQPVRVPTTLTFSTRGETMRGEGEPLTTGGPPTELKTPPQPPAGVVVVDEEKREEKESELHWPPGLQGGAGLFKGVEVSRRQELLDEVTGRMASAIPVRNPVGLLRKLVSLERGGKLTCELAEGVSSTREARKAHQARLDQISSGAAGLVCRQAERVPEAATVLSAVALEGRETLRKYLQELKR